MKSFRLIAIDPGIISFYCPDFDAFYLKVYLHF